MCENNLDLSTFDEEGYTSSEIELQNTPSGSAPFLIRNFLQASSRLLLGKEPALTILRMTLRMKPYFRQKEALH